MSQPSAFPVARPFPAAAARERRDAARHACRIETLYYALGETLSRPRSGCIVNISTTGMTLVVEQAVGRHALLGVELRTHTRSHLLVGRVVRALAYGQSWLVAC